MALLIMSLFLFKWTIPLGIGVHGILYSFEVARKLRDEQSSMQAMQILFEEENGDEHGVQNLFGDSN